MQKLLLAFFLLVNSTIAVQGQTFFPVTHTTGTQTINGVNVTVTGINNATTYNTGCWPGPYWIGNSNNLSGYLFSFSQPQNRFRIRLGAANVGETMAVYANGTKYNITTTDLSSYNTGCNEGDFAIVNGEITVTTTSINGKSSTSGLLNIAFSQLIDSIRVQHMNGVGAGTVFQFDFASDTFVNISPVDTILCVGDTLNINYGIGDTFNTNNVFTAQLSDASGSFSTPTVLGTITSRIGGTFKWGVPSTIANGTGYRVRVVSSSPLRISSDNGTNILIGNTKVTKPVAGNNGPVCLNDTLLLTAFTPTSGVTYHWRGPGYQSTTQNPVFNSPTPTLNGSYIVTAKLFGCSASDTTTVFVFGQSCPTGTAAGYNTPLCKEDTLKLTGTANGTGNTFSWTGPDNFTSNDQNPVLPNAQAAAAGNYILYVSNGNCTSRDTVTVTVKPIPENLNAVYNSPVCSGTPLNFTASSASSGVSYSWTGPNSFTSTSATPSISGSSSVHDGNYIVTATLNGCIRKDTVAVSIKLTPQKPTAGSNSPICAGQQLDLTASSATPNVTYSWTGPNSFSSTTQNPSITNTTTGTSGNYTVTAELNGCSSSETIAVVVKPSPSPVTVSNNGPVCSGVTLQLSAGTSTTGSTYSWTGPGSYSSSTQNNTIPNAVPGMSGWYVLTIDLGGCTFADSTQAVVNPIPNAPVLSYNNPLCVGETLQLNASNINGATYSWSGPGGYTSNIQNATNTNMQISDTGKYQVTATVAGCVSPVADIRVLLNPVPFVAIFPQPSDSICVGQSVTFIALPNNHGGSPQLKWYRNGIPTGNTGNTFISSSLNDADVIRCDMTENTKCSSPYTDQSNEINMSVLPWLAPTVTFTVDPNRPLKPDEYVTFTAQPVNAGNAPTFQWKRNGQNVQGATGAIWSANTLNDNDSISVEVISSYKCPQPASFDADGIRIRVLTSVNSFANTGEINLHPNPNSGSFMLQGKTAASAVDIEVTNMVGQTIYTAHVNVNNNMLKYEVQLPEVANGVYLLKMNADGEQAVVRFRVSR